VGFRFIADSSLRGYDGAWNVMDEEHSLEQKKDAHKGKRTPWTLREFGGKTVWDWLQLLVVPLMLVLITVVFTSQQDARQQDFEERRVEVEQKLENQRAEAERKLAEQRAQDEALQAYLDQMGNLLLERDLRDSEEDSEVQTLARARTATAIQRLDSDRNISVIGFLYEAGLIQTSDQVRLLTGADLQGAHLQGIDLIDADLSGTNLSGADLSDTFLTRAGLHNADLPRVDLSGAVLFKADLHYSYLRNADLGSRVAPGSVFQGRTNLSRAILKGAILDGADLRNAKMQGTDLNGAGLIDANLSGAIVTITNEELEQQAFSLGGATMPNGQKYEEWLKDKKTQGKNEKNE